MTTIVVTHEISSLGMLFMDGGRVVLYAPPAEFFASQHAPAREFLRRVHGVAVA